VKIACVLMQRNEDVCLQPWLRYHGALFGDENLFVLDHHSDDAGVLETLAAAAVRGVHVMRLAAGADYRQKGDYVSYAMRQAEAGYDFVLPLDCDEFVAMRLPCGQPSCAPGEILDYFETLPASGLAFGVAENFLNMLGRPETFFALPYEKVFFRGGHCGVVDHGSHKVLWPLMRVHGTRLVYVHFHHKPFARLRRAAMEKLAPFVDVNDEAALAAFRGPGAHLVLHLQKTEAEYGAIMRPDRRCVAFPAFCERLVSLGIDPGFCEA
jgi:hypothetical protein